MLKERTAGNGVSRLRASLVELHTNKWMRRVLNYLSVLSKLRVEEAAPFPAMQPVPGLQWLASVYVRAVLPRLDETKARVTSVFGDILKMDSTKKVSRPCRVGPA